MRTFFIRSFLEGFYYRLEPTCLEAMVSCAKWLKDIKLINRNPGLLILAASLWAVTWVSRSGEGHAETPAQEQKETGKETRTWRQKHLLTLEGPWPYLPPEAALSEKRDKQ